VNLIQMRATDYFEPVLESHFNSGSSTQDSPPLGTIVSMKNSGLPWLMNVAA
jgi:hypothetical protein